MRRRPILFAALVVAVGLLAYAVTLLALRTRAPSPDAVLSAEDQLDWLAREFRLAPAQTAEIALLQSAYAPVCAAHCAAIAAAQKTLAASAPPDARAAAEAELESLKTVCAVATRAHLQAVAACMPPGQGARFLALMEPRVAHTPDRDGAPALAPPPAP